MNIVVKVISQVESLIQKITFCVDSYLYPIKYSDQKSFQYSLYKHNVMVKGYQLTFIAKCSSIVLTCDETGENIQFESNFYQKVTQITLDIFPKLKTIIVEHYGDTRAQHACLVDIQEKGPNLTFRCQNPVIDCDIEYVPQRKLSFLFSSLFDYEENESVPEEYRLFKRPKCRLYKK